MSEYLTPSQVNTLYPIAGMTVYQGVLVMRRFSRDLNPPRPKPEKSKRIEYLSRRARHNFVLQVARCHVRWLSLMTLSYGLNHPLDGKRVKDDWNAFITSFRRQFGNVKYFWFLEFQARGAPHFHVGLDIGPPQKEDRAIMADLWSRVAEKYDFWYSRCEWVDGQLKFVQEDWTRQACRKQHRREKNWSKIRHENGAIRYVVKYATKPYQKVVPKNYRDVGRFWAISRNIKRDDGLTVGGNEQQVREILAELGRNFDGWEMLPRVIFVQS